MTKSERQEVATRYYELAEWCLDDGGAALWLFVSGECPARAWVTDEFHYYTGEYAALALCFAAAMVEAGDST